MSKEKYCEWIKDTDFEGEPYWITSCGETWYLTEGNLKDNKIKYCCFCGKKIKECER